MEKGRSNGARILEHMNLQQQKRNDMLKRLKSGDKKQTPTKTNTVCGYAMHICDADFDAETY